MEEGFEVLEPSVKNLLEKDTLKWIFVGGKGGVGKTTCSSTLAILLSKIRKSVLIISTDPAHNLSDAFRQKFTTKPKLVNGFDNLYAMEIDPSFEDTNTIPDILQEQQGLLSTIKDISSSLPGIDEAMGFAEVMRLVKSLEFETVVFDTAPTGHTLRLLHFPETMEKTFSRFGSQFSGIMNQFASLFGSQSSDTMDSTNKIIQEVNKQFRDSNLTTFVCVCIPEFLSLYETERLVQELDKFEIDVSNIIINQVLYPQIGTHCDLCQSRSKMQRKYINQIEILYSNFHVTKIPLLENEIGGIDKLEDFSHHMLNSFEKEYIVKKEKNNEK